MRYYWGLQLCTAIASLTRQVNRMHFFSGIGFFPLQLRECRPRRARGGRTEIPCIGEHPFGALYSWAVARGVCQQVGPIFVARGARRRSLILLV